jgi:hypothetical protein
MARFPSLDVPLLFTLTRVILEPICLSKIFIHWQADQWKVLVDAHSARETLVTHCKAESSPVPLHLPR